MKFKADIFREQVNLTLAELGFDPLEVVGLPNMDDVQQLAAANIR